MGKRLKELLVIFVVFQIIYSLKVIPERARVVYFNEQYINNATLSVRRYGRKSAYYMNGVVDHKYLLNNNVTVHIIFNEFLHNEYRRSFIEFHYKLCDLLNKEPYIGGMLVRSGVSCPVYPGVVRLMNMTVPTENFPNVFPFEKGRVDGHFCSTATGEVLLSIEVVCVFKK